MTQDVVIRVYQDSDEAGVVALWREVFPDAPPWNDPLTDIRAKQSHQPELFFVAVVGASVVGTVMAGYDGHRGWVHYVAVKSTYRRRGIGTALMARAEEALARMGCPKLNLQVRGHDRNAISFYRRLRYEVEDRVSMAKRFGG